MAPKDAPPFARCCPIDPHTDYAILPGCHRVEGYPMIEALPLVTAFLVGLAATLLLEVVSFAISRTKSDDSSALDFRHFLLTNPWTKFLVTPLFLGFIYSQLVGPNWRGSIAIQSWDFAECLLLA